MQVDVIIVGQGISGTFLSYYLKQAGISFIVIDQPVTNTASRIASGVINPVTGRRVVKTWMIDEILPFAQHAYEQIGSVIGKQVLSNCPVLEFHPTEQMQIAFQKRLEKNADYIFDASNETIWQERFHYELGIGKVSPALHIDLITLLDCYRETLLEKNQLSEEIFKIDKLIVSNETVNYKDIQAKNIVFCDGVSSIGNPYFQKLPFAPNKGEAIILEIPDLPSDHIYKQGLSLVPWNKDLQQFWIGSTYNWQYDNVLPTQEFAQKVDDTLKKWLKLPYKKIAHLVSLRPANTERRPFVGFSTQYQNVGILNGMGTKGCSLAPFFAKQLVDNMLYGTPIATEGDIKRFDTKK